MRVQDGPRSAPKLPASLKRFLLSLALALVFGQWVQLLQWMQSSAQAQIKPPANDQLPLISQSNLNYIGAFRVPAGSFGPGQNAVFDYAQGPICYCPEHGTLFMVGHTYDQALAEISIPSPVNSTDIAALPTATVLQNFVPILSQVPNQTGAPPNQIGGLIDVNGQILGSAFVYYDAANQCQVSHFRINSLNLSSAQIQGYFQVGANTGQDSGFFGGPMCAIPSNWQSDLGGYPYMTGNGCIPIISRTSFGPSAFGFNPSQLGSSAPATPYFYYPQSNPTLGDYSTDPPTKFNGTAGFSGLFFVPGTRSVLAFGNIGTGAFCYGEYGPNPDGQPNCQDQCGGGKGPHSVGGTYIYCVWAFDANDLVAVQNGQKQPYQVTPYGFWVLALPFASCNHQLGGVTYDAASGRLFICELGGDTEQTYSYKPLVHVFTISGGAPPPSQPPSFDGHGHNGLHQHFHFPHFHFGGHEHFHSIHEHSHPHPNK
jgi:hypothetical protein